MRIYLNPDTAFVEEVRKAVKDNNGYCPCALQKTQDTKCKCKDFRDKIAAGVEGSCNCGMFIAAND